MKKYIPLFLLAFASFFIYSCDDSNDTIQDTDTISSVLQITRSFQFDSQSQTYFIKQGINGMQSTDMVLVYMQTSTFNSSPVWELLPVYMYVSNDVNDTRQVGYRFDFIQNDIQIYAEPMSNFSLSNTPLDVLSNKTFRILIVPANGISKMSSDGVNYKDYKSVIKFYNLDDSNPKILK